MNSFYLSKTRLNKAYFITCYPFKNESPLSKVGMKFSLIILDFILKYKLELDNLLENV